LRFVALCGRIKKILFAGFWKDGRLVSKAEQNLFTRRRTAERQGGGEDQKGYSLAGYPFAFRLLPQNRGVG